MVRGGVRKCARTEYRLAAWVTAAMLCVASAGCATTGTSLSLQPQRDITVAFESIDGPPPAIFRTFVQKLSQEAQARQVPMVTREGFAPYRVRGYLAAGIEKKKKRTVISWVWDVYDAQQQRTFRLSGEEVAGLIGSDAWASADDALLGRIAQKGMGQLADYVRAPAPAVAAPGEDAAPMSRSEPVADAGQQAIALAPRE
jgi:hypothetical protein